jgi:hypothetical protein
VFVASEADPLTLGHLTSGDPGACFTGDNRTRSGQSLLKKKKNWKESVRHFNGGRVRPRDCMLLILAATTLILLSGGSFVEKPGVACKECIELIKLTIAKQNNVKIVLV